MKKRTISIIITIMGLSFVALLLLQIRYIDEMVEMKHEQFDELVNRSLYVACHRLELNETLHALENDATPDTRTPIFADNDTSEAALPLTPFQIHSQNTPPAQASKGLILRRAQTYDDVMRRQQQFRNRYIYQKALLDEVIINMLYAASSEPLETRLNIATLEQNVRTELHNNGIDIPFHITITRQDNREIYRCADYDEEGSEQTYSRVIFQNDPETNTGQIHIHFPTLSKYLFSSVSFMIPAVIFTVILLLVFVFTIAALFRQKRYNEMKNDFVSNMTHELKTPISSISLAAQMLNDGAVSKNEKITQHLGNVINEETRRLRLLVDTVLQMSMFDRKDAVLKKKDTDIAEIVHHVAHAFQLRVEHTQGNIHIDNEATHTHIIADEMHITNAINNIVDNSIKYRDPQRPLHLRIRTWNENNCFAISISDNGMGIKKEHLKKIFDKFYRIHTGNRHDIKGFGLGLAYVRNVATLHGGSISVESEYGKGTTFTLMLPLCQTQQSTTTNN